MGESGQVSPSQHRLILRTAVHTMRTTVKADRIIALYEGYGYSHGFLAGTLWERADLSQGIIADLLTRAQAALIPDAMLHPVFAERTSALLSNIATLLFLPIRTRGGIMRGFLYLDQTRQNKAVLTQPVLDRVQHYVSQTLEPMLHSLVEDLTWEEALAVEWLSAPEPPPAEPESAAI